MNQKSRILFVCYANSTHAQSWINLLHDSPFEARIFTTHLLSMDFGWTPEWNFSTYVTVRPEVKPGMKAPVFWLLPGGKRVKTVSNWLDSHFNLTERYLRRIINTWKPDIIHSLAMDKAGKLVRLALQGISPEDRPGWVVSSYGNDICLDLYDPDKSENVKSILAQCDGFIADCQRDCQLAVSGGLDPARLALDHAVPGPGGLDLEVFARLRQSSSTRNIILAPKAFERDHPHNQTLVILEAFRLLGEDFLQNYEIHFNMCSKSVITYLRMMPEWIQKRVQCHAMLPQDELFAQMARARVMVAPSLTDGTPNVMLEAMAAGALPLMSPVDSIQEWITNGENGLLAHALYPDQVAEALRRALMDDELFEEAQRLNWEIVCQRADRLKVRREVLEYYLNLNQSRKIL